VSANEVLLVGDSFFAQNHQTTGFLEARARESGALGAGDRYRDSSRLTNNALALLGEGLLNEYTSAVLESPVQVVILNGGGADVLLGSCEMVNDQCALLTNAAQALGRLLSTMASDGVTGVVFVGYPDPQSEAVRAKMDALRPMLEAACAASEVPCSWLDLRPIFAGNYDTYIQADGMNPTPQGAEATANAIWATMVESCLAQ